jgi:Ca2+-binding RTX toxin-like protein
MISSPRKRRLGTLSVFSACALILGVLAAAPAFAASCTKNAASADVTATSGGATTVKRGPNDEILVNGAPCGTATVFNVDTIKITGANATAEAVTIDLTGGKFEPGFNTETGRDEIEIEVGLGTGANTLTIQGTDSADTWVFLTQGIDLNNDGDADVTGPAAGNLSDANLAVIANAAGGADWFKQTNATTETLFGGDGIDRVSYTARSTALSVNLDDIANDGAVAPPEGDNVHSDIEKVEGGSGDDTLTGNSSNNILYGYFGADTISGLDGTDTIEGGSPLLPTSASDLGDTLSGGNGSDSIQGMAGGDTITGGAGLDNITDGIGADNVNAGAGRDTINQGPTSNGNDSLAGGAGSDTVSYSQRTAIVTVTLNGAADDGAAAENDNVADDVENIRGGHAGDTIDASGGTAIPRSISGGAGNDTLTGGAAADNISGGDGNDTLNGGLGSDRLFGGDGNDSLFGNDGNDSLSGGDGSDDLHGGDGNDRLNGDGGVGDTDTCSDPQPNKTFRSGCEA